MNEHEQRMCEAQAEFFELSCNRFSCSSSYFIARFMNSEMAKELDDVRNPYNFISPNNLITIMRQEFPSLNRKKGAKYPAPVLHWVGYIYRAYVRIKGNRSSDLYKVLKAERMLALYDSYHTFSAEYCVERLAELIEEGAPKKKSDYEIYKELRKRKTTL